MRLFFIIFICTLTVASCSSVPPKSTSLANTTVKPFALVIHGGAGGILREYINEEQQQAYEDKLTEALHTGYEILEKGGSSLNAVQAAIVVLENSPLFNAGKGAVFNAEGKQEMDASIMDGKTLNAGAVAGINHVKNPILAARMVMDSSSHVMLSGKGAEILAKNYGVEMVDPSYFYTKKRHQQLLNSKKKATPVKKQSSLFKNNYLIDDHKYGTVGAVAIDQEGNIAAGTSTGGMTNKKYGRIGDSPIIGAGTYANNLTCGISATGTGEYFIRTLAAHEISSLVKYKGYSIEKASFEVIHHQIEDLGGKGGVIVLDKNAHITWEFNTTGMFRGFKKSDGSFAIEMFEKIKKN